MKWIILFSLIFIIGCEDQVSLDGDKKTDTVQPVEDCLDTDDSAPNFPNSLVIADDGSTNTSPTISWTEASDDCEFSHYELAIGTTVGGEEVLSFTNIGNVNTYNQESLNLDYSEDYFYALRAVDMAGNTSAIVNSNSWQIFTPQTLTNMVVWLDASQLTSIEDKEGDNPGDANFSSNISKWVDLSQSSNSHDFISTGSKTPSWDVVENAPRFNGTDHYMMTADHTDINTSDVAQRTIHMVVKSGSDINSRQVLFEEGGTVRGLNIYIENGNLYCGFWNNTNDGDGVQPYIDISQAIAENTKYTISYIFDYSHFVDANSVDGTVECVINGVSAGSVNTTSRLHAHAGDIGLGVMNDGSYFTDGSVTGDNYYFDGVVYEFMMYNTAHDSSELAKLQNVLNLKW